MRPFIISFELNDPSYNYQPLYKALQTYSSWAYITKSAWMVSTSRSAAQIRSHLKPYISENDTLFVIEVQPHSWAATNLNQDALAWLKS